MACASRRLLAAVLVAAACASVAVGKVTEGKLRLSSRRTEVPLSKFAVAKGAAATLEGKWSMRKERDAKRWERGNHALKLFVYDAAAWQRFQELTEKGSLCEERTRVATTSVALPKLAPAPIGKQRDHEVKSERFLIKLPPGATGYYYALAADCALEWYDASGLPPILYTLTWQHTDVKHGHLPADERGMFALQALGLVLMTPPLIIIGQRVMHDTQQQASVHLLVVTLGTAYMLQMASMVCEIMHLSVYAHDGKGLRWRHTFFAMDFYSELFESVSELLVSMLLIFLACGWTLSQSLTTLGTVASEHVSAAAAAASKAIKEDRSVSTMMAKVMHGHVREAIAENPEVKRRFTALAAAMRHPAKMASRAGPLAWASLAYCTVYLWLVLLGRREGDADFAQYHDHEHWPGKALMLLRVVMWVIFVGGGYYTRKGATGNQDAYAFLVRLALAGSLWLLAFPLSVLFAAGWLPNWRRHAFVSIMSLLCQAIGLVALLFLVTDEGFRKLSTVGAPGGDGLGDLGGVVSAKKMPKLNVD